MKLSVTKSASDRIKQATKKADFFRIKVESGGCFGFQYIFSFEEEKTEQDLCIEDSGVQVLIDPSSVPFLNEATLDYKEEMIGSCFFIDNPQSKSSCGCKNSFSL